MFMCSLFFLYFTDRTDANAERKAVFSRKRTLSDIDRGGFSRVSSGESADLADNTIHLVSRAIHPYTIIYMIR